MQPLRPGRVTSWPVRTPLVTSLLLCLVGPGVPASDLAAQSRAPSRVERVAAAWVAAFNSGREGPMREFFEQHADSADLVKTPIEQRLANYPQLFEHLAPVEITGLHSSSSTEATFDLSARDGAIELAWSVRLAVTPPHGVVEIRIEGRAPKGQPTAAAPAARQGGVEQFTDADLLPPPPSRGAATAVRVSLSPESTTPVTLTDTSVTGMFDTGASLTGISSSLQESMAYPVIGQHEMGPVVRLDALTIGDVRFEALPAVVLDRPFGGDVLLGLPLFRTMLLTVDLGGGELVLEDGGLSPEMEDVIPYRAFRPGSPLVTVEASVAGNPTPLLLDSGSMVPWIVPMAAAEGWSWGSRRPGPALGGPGVASAPSEWRVLDGAIALGAARFAAPRMLVADLRLSDGDPLPLTAGRPVLASIKITIDQERHLVAVDR